MIPYLYCGRCQMRFEVGFPRASGLEGTRCTVPSPTGRRLIERERCCGLFFWHGRQGNEAVCGIPPSETDCLEPHQNDQPFLPHLARLLPALCLEVA